MVVPITIRQCEATDLPDLEWFGLFSAYRSLFQETFHRQRAGEVSMLVAVANGFPIGQVWLDFSRKRSAGIGIIWALRLMPAWQNHGIGTRLLASAEDILRQQGFVIAELGVSKPNTAAQRLYERLGYGVVGEEDDGWDYQDLTGQMVHVEDPCWIMQKSLGPSRS
ncbi:MAG: GNAT family N-acetyltransferase [Chloroflexota bacterium]|nr:GNAT family N-acetyltransferase [Chloroflexota bacterium]